MQQLAGLRYHETQILYARALLRPPFRQERDELCSKLTECEGKTSPAIKPQTPNNVQESSPIRSGR
jgi:hypothetical protein